MEERLQWIVRTPATWLHWGPLQGGMQVHEKLVRRYSSAQCYVVEGSAAQSQLAQQQLKQPWWNSASWFKRPQFTMPAQPVEMLWANMALHMEADPEALIQRWHAALAVDGFLMFSCLGPDTLSELRPLYAGHSWPAHSHEFTDMHDWGDMLVHAGFAEPIMDMERISLSYSSADSLLAELRGLGRNLHVRRFAALRGRRWHQALCHSLEQRLRGPDGRLNLSFEVIYGHAFKPVPRFAMQAVSRVPLMQLKNALGKKT